VPEHFFNLGPEAPIIRTAGGRVSEVIRSLTTLHALLKLDNVMVIHHTDCGLFYTTDEAIRKTELEHVPEAKEQLENMTWGCFTE